MELGKIIYSIIFFHLSSTHGSKTFKSFNEFPENFIQFPPFPRSYAPQVNIATYLSNNPDVRMIKDNLTAILELLFEYVTPTGEGVSEVCRTASKAYKDQLNKVTIIRELFD